MPRRRIRRTDGQSRQQKMWSAHRKPGMGGVMPFGPSARGGTTVLGRPGGGGQGEVRIEHVTLYAVEGQTIASGGGTVQWFRRGGPPTEQVGFATLASELDGGAVGAVPIDVTGYAYVYYRRRFDTFRQSGDVTVRITRNGATIDHTVPMGAPAARAFDEPLGRFWLQAGDTLAVIEPNDSGAGQDLVDGADQTVLDITIWSNAATTSNVPQPFDWDVDGITFHQGGPTGIQVPADTVEGDLLVAFCIGRSDSGPTPATCTWDMAAAGWTEFEDHKDDDTRGFFFGFYRLATAADTPGDVIGASLTGCSGTSPAAATALRIPQARVVNASTGSEDTTTVAASSSQLAIAVAGATSDSTFVNVVASLDQTAIKTDSAADLADLASRLTPGAAGTFTLTHDGIFGWVIGLTLEGAS